MAKISLGIHYLMCIWFGRIYERQDTVQSSSRSAQTST